MILLFDVGNTNIYVGFGEKDKILNTFRLTTELNKSPDEYYLTIKNFVDNYKISGIVIGSVVPQVTISLIKIARKYFNLEPLVLAPGIKTGIKVIADNPREVGSDIIAVAAGIDNGSSYLIVDLGTANKFIYVKKNTITGVIISPGISLSIKALNLNTALLPEVEIKFPNKYLGNNTIHCIQSGVLYGTVALIEGFINKIKEEVNEEFTVILTGGLSKLFLPYLNDKVIRESRLVLKGLLNIYYRN